MLETFPILPDKIRALLLAAFFGGLAGFVVGFLIRGMI